MVIFISQPMSKKSEEEIVAQRQRAIEKITKKYGHDVEILNTYFNDDYRHSVEEALGCTLKNKDLFWLSQALEFLSDADVIWLCDGWEWSKGCLVERKCAELYGIPEKFDADYK